MNAKPISKHPSIPQAHSSHCWLQLNKLRGILTHLGKLYSFDCPSTHTHSFPYSTQSPIPFPRLTYLVSPVHLLPDIHIPNVRQLSKCFQNWPVINQHFILFIQLTSHLPMGLADSTKITPISSHSTLNITENLNAQFLDPYTVASTSKSNKGVHLPPHRVDSTVVWVCCDPPNHTCQS